MRILSKLFIIVVAITAVVSHAHAQTADSFVAALNVPAVFSRDVTQLYNQSATFRAQCERLAQAQNIRVNMQLDVSIPQSCRAYTIIRRARGMLCADVHLPVTRQFAELVAHEFEHIIEQLEHVNLRKFAMVRGSGVRQVGFELFETDRAQLAGMAVAQELRQSAASLQRSAASKTEGW
jgi:hypothetical protein